MNAAASAAPAEVVNLRAGCLHAAVRPDLGGSLAGLWLDHGSETVAVLRSTAAEALEGPRQSAGFAMLPYSNRIGHGRFDWHGLPLRTAPNFGSSPHSLHGLGWQRPWSVVMQDRRRVQLQLKHAPDADWPFAFEATQHIELAAEDTPGGAASLQWTLSLRNTDTRSQPAGLGWHPYFPRRPDSRIQARVSARWERDAQDLPTCATPHASLDNLVSTLALDHCFDGWGGCATVLDAHHRVELSASTKRLVIFTPSGAGHFCVEPVSHVNNAVQMADPTANGLVDLAPGAVLEGWMRLRVKPAEQAPA